MILNFRDRFADAVRTGAKTQTIRRAKDGSDGPRIGAAVHLYAGIRTPKQRKLGTGVVSRVRAVTISKRGEVKLVEWIRGVYGLPFSGRLIEWEVNW